MRELIKVRFIMTKKLGGQIIDVGAGNNSRINPFHIFGAMQESDDEVLTEEQKKLIEDNMDFVYWWFHKNEIYDEDPQQDYWYAICKHIHLFD